MASDGVLILGARAPDVARALCDVVRRERRARDASRAAGDDDDDDDDDVDDERRRLHLDTKYYNVRDVATCLGVDGDARSVTVDGAIVEDFTMRAYGVKAVVLTSGEGEDDDDFSRLAETHRVAANAFRDEMRDVDVKVLVYDVRGGDSGKSDAVPACVRAFALEEGFEVVAATVGDALADARLFGLRGEGMARVVRALEAVMWSTMVLKPLGETSDLGREMRSKEKAAVVNALASTLGMLGEVDSPRFAGDPNASADDVHARIAAMYDSQVDNNSESAREARIDKLAELLMLSDL